MSTKVYYINSDVAQYNDQEFAWLQSLFLTQGVVGDQESGALGLEVIEETPLANMSVNVGVGKALVEITKEGRTFKVVAEVTAEENISVTNNTTGDDRVDAVIMRVDVDNEPNVLKNNIVTLEVIEGTGNTALSDNDIQTEIGNDGFYRLANITVPDSAVQIQDEDITDTRGIVYFNNGIGFSPLFINESQADPVDANNAGKVVKLEDDGKFSNRFIRRKNINILDTTGTLLAVDSTSRFDISDEGSNIFRYTWDGTGTNPNITSSNPSIGSVLCIQGDNFNSNNNGLFVVISSDTNWFEVENINGVAELDKTIGATGFIGFGDEYIADSNIEWIEVEVVGGGASGASPQVGELGGGGGGAGAYVKKIYDKIDLINPILYFIGKEGSAVGYNSVGNNGLSSFFGDIVAGGGEKGYQDDNAEFSRGGFGGVGSNGDINIGGGDGQDGQTGEDISSPVNGKGGLGGNSFFGGGGKGSPRTGKSAGSGNAYGAGGGGGFSDDNDVGSCTSGGAGFQGVIIITEY